MEDKQKFEVLIIGIIFDPRKKKILIGRAEEDNTLPGLTWFFPGELANQEEDVDKTLKKTLKLKTGYDVKNLGAIFSKVYPEKPDLLAVYFLTEAFSGEEKAGGDLVELKWVSPKELENYFTTSFHKKLKQYLIELVE
jgi:ADP-ribose pyrophosphatase YjhB (NUDIX family)